MALDFTNTAGSLFNRLGRIGKIADVSRVAQDDLVEFFDEMLAQYDSSVASPLQIVTNGTPAKRDAAVSQASSFMASLSTEAQQTVIKMVLADAPSSGGTLLSSLNEVRKQMLTQGKTIQECAVASTATADGDNAGDGVLVVSTKRGDGLTNELMFDETAYVTCSTDSQSGGAAVGQETFVYVGEPRDTSVWASTYPTGPGASSTLLAIDSTVDAEASQSTGNLLVNSDFEDFTANLPDYWEAVVGVAGTDFFLSTDEYSGTNCLRILGGGDNVLLSQTLNDADGSEAVLVPSQSYAVSLRIKNDANPSTGTLVIELVDGNDTVTQDDQGVNNAFTIDLTTLGTSYVSKTGVFRTPRLLPATYKLSVRVGTDIQATRNTFVDHLAFGPLAATYPGGPGIAVFSGATKFAFGDKFSLVTTNDYGGSTRVATFHWLLERLLGIRAMGVLFPTSSTPDIEDTLITA